MIDIKINNFEFTNNSLQIFKDSEDYFFIIEKGSRLEKSGSLDEGILCTIDKVIDEKGLFCIKLHSDFSINRHRNYIFIHTNSKFNFVTSVSLSSNRHELFFNFPDFINFGEQRKHPREFVINKKELVEFSYQRKDRNENGISALTLHDHSKGGFALIIPDKIFRKMSHRGRFRIIKSTTAKVDAHKEVEYVNSTDYQKRTLFSSKLVKVSFKYKD